MAKAKEVKPSGKTVKMYRKKDGGIQEADVHEDETFEFGKGGWSTAKPK